MPRHVLNNISPFIKLYVKKPDYECFRIVGCACFPFLIPYSKYKLNFHTQKYIMIGHSLVHKGYKCLSSADKIYIARHVQFNESEFPYSELVSSSKFDQNLSLVQESHSHVSNIFLLSISQDTSYA